MENTRGGQGRCGCVLPVLVAVWAIFMALLGTAGQMGKDRVPDPEQMEMPAYIQERFITVDGHSRQGLELEAVRDIVIHYVGNPGTTAEQNRSWYEDPQSTVSSHFLVGLEGEVIQCLPLNEVSSATGRRNRDTISIEVCHPDDTGKFTDATYESLVELTAWLARECGLDAEHVIRHYDVTGKECPRYYVRSEEAWEQFKADVARRIG